jgi:hypothetical protein
VIHRFLAIACLLALTSCASYDGRGLVPGQATEAQVESLMGPSADARRGRNGDTYRYYPRLPYGRATYVAHFDANGKLEAIEQRLQEASFAAIKPGVTTVDEVRFLLGPPNRVVKFPRMQREGLEYPWRGRNGVELLFVVQYSPDGIVREAQTIDDPEFQQRYE